MIKRLNAYEQADVLDIAAAISLAERVQLDERLAGVKYGKRDLGMARSALVRVLEHIFETVPLEQLKSIRRQLQLIEFSTGVKGAGVTQADKTYGRFLTFEQIGALVDACRDTCMLCDKLPGTLKRCKLRKALDALPLNVDMCLDEFEYYEGEGL